MHPYDLEIQALDVTTQHRTFYKFGDCPDWIKGKKFYKYIRIGMYDSVNCWVTGIPLYAVISRLTANPQHLIPWAFSRDHLIPIYTINDQYLCHNFILCSYYLNKKFGHTPYIIKLAVKRYLETLEYPKDQTFENARHIFFNLIIPFYEQFYINNKPIWCTSHLKSDDIPEVITEFWKMSNSFDAKFIAYHTGKIRYDVVKRNIFEREVQLDGLDKFKFGA